MGIVRKEITLKDLTALVVELLDCVVLEVVEDRMSHLLAAKYLNGREKYIQVVRKNPGRDNPDYFYRIVERDGSSVSWQHREPKHQLLGKKQDMILDCIHEDYGISF